MWRWVSTCKYGQHYRGLQVGGRPAPGIRRWWWTDEAGARVPRCRSGETDATKLLNDASKSDREKAEPHAGGNV